MSKVTKIYPENALENPDNVLEQAIGEYESCIIIGYNKDGFMETRCSTNIDQANVNFLIDNFKYALLSGEYSEDQDLH